MTAINSLMQKNKIIYNFVDLIKKKRREVFFRSEV